MTGGHWLASRTLFIILKGQREKRGGGAGGEGQAACFLELYALRLPVSLEFYISRPALPRCSPLFS